MTTCLTIGLHTCMMSEPEPALAHAPRHGAPRTVALARSHSAPSYARRRGRLPDALSSSINSTKHLRDVIRASEISACGCKDTTRRSEAELNTGSSVDPRQRRRHGTRAQPVPRDISTHCPPPPGRRACHVHLLRGRLHTRHVTGYNIIREIKVSNELVSDVACECHDNRWCGGRECISTSTRSAGRPDNAFDADSAR